MVLDDASPQGSMGGGYGDTPTPNETYVPENAEFPIPKHAPLYVRPETITRPGFFIMAFYPGPWQWRRKLTFTINQRLGNMQAITGRPLTQDEVDAIATHTSRKIYQERIGVPLGLAQTYNSVCRTLQTWEPWHYYYRRPGKWVHPVDGFKAVRDMAMTDSAAAVKLLGTVGWRGFFWTLAGMSVMSIGATFIETTGLSLDRRLNTFREEAKVQDPEVKARKKMEAWKREAAEKAGKKVPEPVASPQVGVEDQWQQPQGLGQEQEQSSSASTGWGSSSPSPSPSPSPSSRSQPIAEEPRSFDFFDDQDDASPTSPKYRAAERKNQGGSMWERIRQQNMSGSSSEGSQSQWDESSSSRSSSSNADWSRKREREQSQAEFDRLIEAERNSSADTWSGGKSW